MIRLTPLAKRANLSPQSILTTSDFHIVNYRRFLKPIIFQTRPLQVPQTTRKYGCCPG